jgi:DNA repair protein RecN (Recombination protein N)
MLTDLKIENFAIIQNLEIQPGTGLVTFTGETGAGKSIILDAIIALLGGKADGTLIRSGAERAILEATFTLPASSKTELTQILEREELLDDQQYVNLGREIRREGRSVARVNGRSVSLSLLRELGTYLVDIHGQSEHLSLLNVRQHVRLLDRYADCDLALKSYVETYRRLTSLRHELDELRRSEQDAARTADLLNFQIQEIASAHLRSGEEEELRLERDRLANAENLAALAQQCLQILEEGSPEAPSLSDLFGTVVKSLSNLARIDSSQTELCSQAETVADNLGDIAHSLRDYLDGIEFNPRRLAQVEERLELIRNLKRKYGGDIKAVLAFSIDANARLDKIIHADEMIEELEKEEHIQLKEIALRGQKLSALRHSAAQTMACGVEKELADLSMEAARFKVEINFEADAKGVLLDDGQTVAFDQSGFDRVEFFIAPNPGEGFKPLVKIASGGETSRLMLALKNVLANADFVPTLIFDEIDQGIGGRTGAVIGEKLWQLGWKHQVLCVTHLPQLAAFGDFHYRVLKQITDGRTLTQVKLLEGSSRTEELAQMLGGTGKAHLNAAVEAQEFARQRSAELRGK